MKSEHFTNRRFIKGIAKGLKAADPSNYVGPIYTQPNGVYWSNILGRHVGCVINDLDLYGIPNFNGTVTQCFTQNEAQTAINNAAASGTAGDVIEIDPSIVLGTTGGNQSALRLPVRNVSTGYIQIRPLLANYNALPAYTSGNSPSFWGSSSQIKPSDSANLIKLEQRHVNTSVMAFAKGTSGWWLSGFEAYPGATTPTNSGNLVWCEGCDPGIGPNQTLISDQPDRIIFDRWYAHNRAVSPINVRRAFIANGKNLAFLHCYIENMFWLGQDSQAIISYNCEGPLAVLGSFLEGMAENFFIGGADPAISGVNPSDIHFQYNTVYKRPEWNNQSGCKNQLEAKKGKRVCFANNKLDGNYHQGQFFAITLKATNQNGGDPTARLEDVTTWGNVLINNYTGFYTPAGNSETPVSAKMARIECAHNLQYKVPGAFGDVGCPPDRNSLRLIGFFNDSHVGGGGYPDIYTHHNSISCIQSLANDLVAIADWPYTANWVNFAFKSNVTDAASLFGPVYASNVGANLAALGIIGDWEYATNGGPNTGAQYAAALLASPHNNKAIVPASIFVDPYTDLRLVDGSPLKLAGYDGLDIGANVELVLSHLYGI